MFLVPADFVGKYKLAKDCYSKELLQQYIDKYEKYYLQDLLGCTLYEEFVDDLTLNEPIVPQDIRFTEIFEEKCTDGSCGVMYRSEGMLEMLKGYVYYHYLLDQKFKNTIVGTVVDNATFSREVATAKSTIEDRYNLATDTYVAIQLYIIDNSVTYPEFNGITKRLSFFGGAF